MNEILQCSNVATAPCSDRTIILGMVRRMYTQYIALQGASTVPNMSAWSAASYPRRKSGNMWMLSIPTHASAFSPVAICSALSFASSAPLGTSSSAELLQHSSLARRGVACTRAQQYRQHEAQRQQSPLSDAQWYLRNQAWRGAHVACCLCSQSISEA